MGAATRIFLLLLKKNFLVRKRHWIQSLIVQTLIPLGLILLGESVRFMTDSAPERISTNTIHDIIHRDKFLEEINKDITIRFTPNIQSTRDLMELARNNCLHLRPERVIGSENEDTMIVELQRDQTTSKSLINHIGIVFEGMKNNTLPKRLRYRIRINKKISEELYDSMENGNAAQYVFGSIPVAEIQMCVDESYIKNLSDGKSLYNFSIQQMPYPPYVSVSKAEDMTNEFIAEIIRIIFLIVLCIELTFPANEKLIGINILMSVNGVKNSFNLLSWLVSALIFSVSYLLPLVVMLKYFMPPKVTPFLLYGNSFLVWLALFIHLIQVITFGYHISSYFWKPIHSVFATFMVMTLMNIVVEYVHGYAVERFFLYLGIIFPNFILNRISGEIIIYESKLIGISFLNMFTAGKSGGPPESSIGMMMLFSIIGAFFHFFMTIYINNVRPGKYGIPKSLFYFLKWRNKWNKVNGDDSGSVFESTLPDGREFEHVPVGSLEPGIRIRELKKIYTMDLFNKSTVYALRGVSIDFYKSQITALLGHNGAGKTTMMSILSGLTDATEGNITIDGKNIQRDDAVISDNIGLCPQENIVFPDLTVYQQLHFFGTLKGRDKIFSRLKSEVDTLLEKVDLVDKIDAYPQQLSGGQKRRLCLAMAVIGDGNVLILDEPTSGMDAENKREVWDIVLKMRGEKTIIISTHDMEEADILGDRVAIMHTGKIKCYGTAMFLKKLYGEGQIEVTLSTESWCDLSKVVGTMGIQNIQILNQDEGKKVLAVPRVDSLPKALDELEKMKKPLGVTGISVSMITLEQVFLRVTREDGDEVDSPEIIPSFQKIVGIPYYIQTFIAFFIKKMIFARKKPWISLISLILPCLSFVLILLQYGLTSRVISPVPLSLRSYPDTTAFVYTNNISKMNRFVESYKQSVQYFGGNVEYATAPSLTDALLNYATKDLGSYRNKIIVSAEFNDTGNNIQVNGLYSGTARLSIPITVNMLSNALVKTFVNESYRIEAYVHTLPGMDETDRDAGAAITITMFMLVFLGPAVAMFVTQPLLELMSGVKQLQLMTGAPKLTYWGATFAFDFIIYIISILILMIPSVIVDKVLGTRLYYSYELFIFFGLLFLFGISVLPFTYLISFLKRTLSTSIIILSISPIVLSIVEMILVLVSQTVTNETYTAFRNVQSKLFLLIPHVSFFYGHLSYYTVLYENARCRRMPNRLLDIICKSGGDICCALECYDGQCENPMSYFTDMTFFPSLKTSLLCLAGSTVLFFILIFILEEELLTKIIMMARKTKSIDDIAGMDELVLEEKKTVDFEIAKIMKNHRNLQLEDENILLVQGLTKYYGSFGAVRGTTFRVKEGECFGLLGVNGAGKSTTFKMLTGAIMSNKGTIYLQKYNMATERTNYLKEMGYCPQHDAIIDTFNSWDHLYLFARLRGIPKSQIQNTVKKWITKLNLTACAAQASSTYSGGNKRRLNIALALIGNPQLVLMDEPTTGVDPAARRSLWNTLKTCQDAGQSIILTSHSMEECEVLCNRLVIMVKGRLVCVGASQVLKQRFGAGFNIHIKLIPDKAIADISSIKLDIESKLTCNLIDQNSSFLSYHVTDSSTTWTKMYMIMNQLKDNYDCIEDFAVLTSTLEQLFIQFARSPSAQTNNV